MQGMRELGVRGAAKDSDTDSGVSWSCWLLLLLLLDAISTRAAKPSNTFICLNFASCTTAWKESPLMVSGA